VLLLLSSLVPTWKHALMLYVFSLIALVGKIFFWRNVSNTHSNTHFSTHSLWLVKIYMGPTKSCGSYINLVGPMWFLTNQRECVEKCVLECVLLAFLYFFDLIRYILIEKAHVGQIDDDNIIKHPCWNIECI